MQSRALLSLAADVVVLANPSAVRQLHEVALVVALDELRVAINEDGITSTLIHKGGLAAHRRSEARTAKSTWRLNGAGKAISNDDRLGRSLRAAHAHGGPSRCGAARHVGKRIIDGSGAVDCAEADAVVGVDPSHRYP